MDSSRATPHNDYTAIRVQYREGDNAGIGDNSTPEHFYGEQSSGSSDPARDVEIPTTRRLPMSDLLSMTPTALTQARPSSSSNNNSTDRSHSSLQQRPPANIEYRLRQDNRQKLGHDLAGSTKQQQPQTHNDQQPEQPVPGAFSVEGSLGGGGGRLPTSSATSHPEYTVVEGELLPTMHCAKRRFAQLGCLGVFLAAAIIITVVATKISKDNSTDIGKPLTEGQKAEIIRSSIASLSQDTSVLDDPTSPQSKALNWLIVKDDLVRTNFESIFPAGTAATTVDADDEDEEASRLVKRLQTRYSLAVLYYSTHGVNWLDSNRFLTPSLHECKWTTVSNSNSDGGGEGEEAKSGVICNDNLEVTEIHIGKNKKQDYDFIRSLELCTR